MMTNLCFGLLIEIAQSAFWVICVNVYSPVEILPFVMTKGQNGEIVPF